MRHFDESYLYAKKSCRQWWPGKITAMRCYSIDPSAGLDSFIQFAKNSAVVESFRYVDP